MKTTLKKLVLFTIIFSSILLNQLAFANNGPKLTIINAIDIPDATIMENVSIAMPYSLTSIKDNTIFTGESTIHLPNKINYVDWSGFPNFKLNSLSITGFSINNKKEQVNFIPDTTCRLQNLLINIKNATITVTAKPIVPNIDYYLECSLTNS